MDGPDVSKKPIGGGRAPAAQRRAAATYMTPLSRDVEPLSRKPAKPKRPARKSENVVHGEILGWMREHVTTFVWHVPNGQRRTGGESRMAKALGMMAGVPDLCFVLRGGQAGFLEVKREGATPSMVSPYQRLFGRKAIERGALWAVVASKQEAIDQCKAWGIVRASKRQP